jgi:hypothetical protein
MPRKYVYYLVFLAVLAGVGYYGYHKWAEAREKVNLWTLVPEDAVFVLESGNHEQFVSRLKRTQVWESLSEIIYQRRLEENMALIDSIGGGRQSLYKFLSAKKMLTSVHVVSKTDFDLVFYVPISTVKEHRFVRTLGENLEKSASFSQSTHEYKRIVITDIKNQRNGEILSHFTYRNNLILSQSSVLLEEIIRKIQRKQFESVAPEFSNVDYLTQEKVYGNVFINYHNLPPFLNLFLKPELRDDLEYLSGLCQNGMLEFKLENNKLYLSGFSNPQTISQSFYQHLAGQKPKGIQLRQYISNRMAIFMHFGLDNFRALKEYKSKKTIARTPEELVWADSLARTFKGELALGFLQTFNPATPSEKVVYAQKIEEGRTGIVLNELIKNTAASSKTKTYREKFGRYSIRVIPIAEFPELLFGKLFRGFEQCFIVELPEYVLFADNVATLRTILTDIEAENVWGKSVAQKAFLDDAQQATNFSVFVNSVNAWQMLYRSVVNEKRETLLRNEDLIKDFSQFALQFSAVDKQYYTSILFRQPDARTVEDERSDSLAVTLAVKFKSKIIAGPFAVRSPLNRSLEMIVQDSSLALHSVAVNGTVNWTDSLNETVVGDIIQASFGSDGKTKYLFTTSTKIHCLDRNGKEIENFPYFLPDTIQAQRLSVIDFNKDGNHQLLVDDKQGNLFLYDEVGDLLPGWSPKALDGKLAAAPQVYKVGVKNVVLAVLENGYVYALNEEGDTYPGFPFSAKANVNSGAFGKAGSNLRKSEFKLVTVKGEVISFNLAGEVLKRHQLLRPDKSATFELIPENNGKSFLIARQSLGRISLFDPAYRLLLERKFFTSSDKIIQYFLFGGDKIVYAITETGPEKTYLFDGKAKPLGKHAFENRKPIKLYYNDVTREYQLYKVYGREIDKITLPRE